MFADYGHFQDYFNVCVVGKHGKKRGNSRSVFRQVPEAMFRLGARAREPGTGTESERGLGHTSKEQLSLNLV